MIEVDLMGVYPTAYCRCLPSRLLPAHPPCAAPRASRCWMDVQFVLVFAHPSPKHTRFAHTAYHCLHSSACLATALQRRRWRLTAPGMVGDKNATASAAPSCRAASTGAPANRTFRATTLTRHRLRRGFVLLWIVMDGRELYLPYSTRTVTGWLRGRY